MSRLNVFLVLAAGLVWLLAACAAPPVPSAPAAQPTAASEPTVGEPQPTTAESPTAVPPTAAPPAAAATAASTTASQTGVTVTDSAGRSVTFASPPTRIISLAPSTTEIVCAVGACAQLVGVDQFSDFPAEVKELPRISDGFNPNYEQIVAAKPDLVLAAGVTAPDVIKKLEELQLPVLVVGAEKTSFETIMSEIRMVGTVLGASAKADAVAGELEKQIEDVRTRVATATTKPRVFWELDATDPAKPFTAGPGSFVHEILTVAGGENIAAGASAPYPQLNAEEIIRADPQIIIMSDAAYGVAPESVGQRPGWDVITAVKENHVFPIDDNLVSRPGPRVGLGLEAAAKLIHPELFETSSGAQTTYDDPFAYCSAVGSANTPAAPYNGPAKPTSVLDGLRAAMGGNVGIPQDVFAQGTFWRCMGGHVYACNVGANIPCESKAETSKTPTQGEVDYCKQNPNTDFIPAYVTGHATIYEWACKNGAPEIVKQVLDVDAEGYPAQFWYEIKP